MSAWLKEDLKPPLSGKDPVRSRFNGKPPLEHDPSWKIGSSPKEAAAAALGKGGQSRLPQNTPK
ncbi:MAG: hypothetical protein JNL76_03640 [Alphaproteobacteria bacterium]|nr:hypothetical protein [Alphaproteobacteria bacterium]